jgi:predicted ATP-grasp superfamily ATP-dependent carboligase
VLLLDGETRQSLTCARALGRAGIEVGVAAERRDRAPAMHSRWCRIAAILPALAGSPDVYVDELNTFLDRQRTAVVIPAHDGSIEAIRPRRAEIEHRCALALASESALEIAVDKEKTLVLARDLGVTIPRSSEVKCVGDVEAAVAEVGLPAVLKPRRSWVGSADGGSRLGSLAVTDLDEARAAFETITSGGGEVTVQQWLPGRRDAVTLFVTGSDVKACFAQTSHRELPRLGGVSVLCESIAPLDDIIKPAQRLVCEMGLEGCSTVEFRRDANGAPVLMEINPRIPGSIALAVGCGVDFPTLTHTWALGGPVPKIDGYQIGRRLHWMVGDLWSLYSAFNHDAGPDVPAPRSAAREFLRDLTRHDLSATFDIRDPAPAIAEARALLVRPIIHRLSRALSGRYHSTAKGK